MKYNTEHLERVTAVYNKIKNDVDKRIEEFQKIWCDGTEEDVFAEFAFCIFTPQSKARSCWKAVEILKEKGLLFKGNAAEIAEVINLVRFRNNKSRYLVEAREFFTRDGAMAVREVIASYKADTEKREFIVKNIKGFGWKEGGHFLRNVGFADELAILDRHILKNLAALNVIPEIPKTISDKMYFEIEKRMQEFALETGIKMRYLDFALWYNEAGEIFK